MRFAATGIVLDNATKTTNMSLPYGGFIMFNNVQGSCIYQAELEVCDKDAAKNALRALLGTDNPNILCLEEQNKDCGGEREFYVAWGAVLGYIPS